MYNSSHRLTNCIYYIFACICSMFSAWVDPLRFGSKRKQQFWADIFRKSKFLPVNLPICFTHVISPKM